MERKPLIISAALVVIIIAIVAMIFTQSSTGNVVSEIHESAYLNQPLSGTFKIIVEQKDNLAPNTPLFAALFKDNKEINVQTMTLEEFVKLSSTQPVLNSEGNYIGPASYEVPILKIIPDKLSSSGDYELIFGLPKIDLLVKKIITVQ